MRISHTLLLFGSVVATVTIGSTHAQVGQPRVEVLTSHVIALRFSPEYPHGRHTQNPLPGEGLILPAPESTLIKGQAGQGSENTLTSASYRVPVPDFVADAGIQSVSLVADLELSPNAAAPVIDGIRSHVQQMGGIGANLKRAASRIPLTHMQIFDSDLLGEVVNPAEITVEFAVAKNDSIRLHGAKGPNRQDPILLVQTRSEVNQKAGWASKEQSGLQQPAIAPLFDQFLRDTSIVLGPDGIYYMTGTTGGPEMMVVTADLSVWKSSDLWNWTPVRDKPRQSTVVWNIDRDGTWMRPITLRDGEPFRPLWAPEIHYMNGTFWIPFSVPRHGVTLLKSSSGKAEGPYEIAITPDKPVSEGIDASLFQDDDGTVYFLYGGGWIARMKSDMSGIAEPFRHISSASGREVGFEGVYLFKDSGLYTLCVADFVQGEYNTYIATSKSLAGPWSERYLAVPHAGHANFFRDKEGRMWSTFFGNDRNSPFSARPGIIPLHLDSKGRWHPDLSVSPQKNAPSRTVAASIQVFGAIGPSDGQPQHVGIMPSGK